MEKLYLAVLLLFLGAPPVLTGTIKIQGVSSVSGAVTPKSPTSSILPGSLHLSSQKLEKFPRVPTKTASFDDLPDQSADLKAIHYVRRPVMKATKLQLKSFPLPKKPSRLPERLIDFKRSATKSTPHHRQLGVGIRDSDQVFPLTLLTSRNSSMVCAVQEIPGGMYPSESNGENYNIQEGNPQPVNMQTLVNMANYYPMHNCCNIRDHKGKSDLTMYDIFNTTAGVLSILKMAFKITRYAWRKLLCTELK